MIVLTDLQEVDAAASFLDAAGNPAPVDGAPVWASSNPDVATVVASEDGLTAVVSATGPLGQAQISVTADADLGSGAVSITGVLDVDVRASQAVAASVTPGTPRDKTPPAPAVP